MNRVDRIRADFLAGLTTAFALVPECIAFALVAQLNPLMGLYGAFIICTLTGLLGGRIALESYCGQGSRFTLELPLCAPMPSAGTAQDAP